MYRLLCKAPISLVVAGNSYNCSVGDRLTLTSTEGQHVISNYAKYFVLVSVDEETIPKPQQVAESPMDSSKTSVEQEPVSESPAQVEKLETPEPEEVDAEIKPIKTTTSRKK